MRSRPMASAGAGGAAWRVLGVPELLDHVGHCLRIGWGAVEEGWKERAPQGPRICGEVVPQPTLCTPIPRSNGVQGLGDGQPQPLHSTPTVLWPLCQPQLANFPTHTAKTKFSGLLGPSRVTVFSVLFCCPAQSSKMQKALAQQDSTASDKALVLHVVHWGFDRLDHLACLIVP